LSIGFENILLIRNITENRPVFTGFKVLEVEVLGMADQAKKACFLRKIDIFDKLAIIIYAEIS
jgi:hypothetical protein